MLVIRDAQWRVLEDSNLSLWLRGHLSTFFPEQCRILGDPSLDLAIAEGVSKARGYGFTEPGDISRYLDVAFELGAAFDREPATAWTHPFLRATEPGDATARMDDLVAAVLAKAKGGA